MAEQLLGIRKYLQDQGYGDNDIGYSNGNVTLKGQNLISATPQTQNDLNQGLYKDSTYASGSALKSALAGYQNTYGAPKVATTSKLSNLNDSLYRNATAQPYEFKQQQPAFSYDPNSDVQYQNALKSALSGAQQASNNAQSQLGARGIGNSSIASNMANQIQQKAVGDVTTNVLPQLIQQAYQRYQDQNNNDYRNQVANYGVGQDQFKNQSALSSYFNGLGQQDFNNNLATNQDTRAQTAQDANFTGFYQDSNTSAIRKAMEANSAAYASASPEEQKRLHDENVKLAASIGGTDTTGNGDYSFGPGSRTLAGQNQDFNQGQVRYENAQNEQQRAFENKLKTEMQGATISNMSGDNARGWASEARAAGNQQLGNLFDVWDRTGVAPAGIPGVQAGTPLNKGGSKSTGQTASDYYKELDSSMYITPETTTDQFGKSTNTGKTVVSDPDGLENYIFSLDLAPEETYKLLNRYKLVKK